ncbi:MAG: acyltransferase [Bacteroidales bacterium]|nr:acyltransferase [Bacteroidales bacterium]
MATKAIQKADQKSDRQYYIDWLRILLIFSVFLFHIGMIFNSWGWHVKNDVTAGPKSVLWYIMVFLHEWRMPLLILISGAGTCFALGKRTSWQYLGERFKRLFIPLLVGVFTLVPVQVYIEKTAQFGSLLEFYPHMFDGIYPEGNFSWHHLWFIAYLFFIALLISPFLNFLRSGQFDLFVGKLARIVSKKLGANIFVIPMLLSQLFLRPYFPENTHGLFDDWAEVVYFLIFFLTGFILLSDNIITESIRKQKWLFFTEAFTTAVVLMTVPYMMTEKAGNLLWDMLEPFVAFSCGLTAIGFAKQYLTKNNTLRKLANEAVYPFYLLHQPVIVVIGYFMVKWDVSVLAKVLLITLTSFTFTIAVYWYFIRPFKAMRLIFGMKMTRNNREEPQLSRSPILIPGVVKRFSIIVVLGVMALTLSGQNLTQTEKGKTYDAE